MKNLVQLLGDHLLTRERISYRDRRGHYASDCLKCLRDQYWAWKNIPATNPPDLHGYLSMMVGDAIEQEVIGRVLKSLTEKGVIVLGTQVAVGGSNPDWNGYLDALCKHQVDGVWKTFVLEHKVKSGIGADIFHEKLRIQDDHLCQLGLYLKDLTEKNITSEGILWYTLLSDSNYGEMVQICCKYHAKEEEINAHAVKFLDGTSKVIDQSFSVRYALERWKKLDDHLAKNLPPTPEYKYKYDLTPELLMSISDDKLRKAIRGEVILGDWQVKYSKYKDLQLSTDNINQKYTNTELGLLKSEYRKRHPRSKI